VLFVVALLPEDEFVIVLELLEPLPDCVPASLGLVP